MLLLGMLLLTGCSARAHELEESAVVKALAFDRGEEGYEISAYVAGAEKQAVISARAGSVGEGLYLLNAQTERKIFLGKNRVILISSEIRDIGEILLSLYSSQEARTGAKVLIVHGTAKDALSYEGLYGDAPTDIEKTVENASQHGNYPAVTLYGAVNSMAAERGCCVLPEVKMQEKNLEVFRCAVYREYMLLQTLTQEEILGCALLRGAKNAYFAQGSAGYALREIEMETDCGQDVNQIRIRCSFRCLAAGEETPREEDLAQALETAARAAYETAQKLGADFLELYPGDVSLPAEITVTVIPESNGYPLKGVMSK